MLHRYPRLSARDRARRQRDIDVLLLLVFGPRYLPNDVAERLAQRREYHLNLSRALESSVGTMAT